MFCRNCGKELPEGTAVCPECGEVLMPAASSGQGGNTQTGEGQNSGNSYTYDSQTGNYTYGTPNQGYQYGGENPYNPDSQKGNGVAIASLICGIFGLITCCCNPIINLPLSIAALVCGILGIKSQNKGMAIAGIVLGSVGILLGIIVAVGFIAFQPYQERIWEEIYDSL